MKYLLFISEMNSSDIDSIWEVVKEIKETVSRLEKRILSSARCVRVWDRRFGVEVRLKEDELLCVLPEVCIGNRGVRFVRLVTTRSIWPKDKERDADSRHCVAVGEGMTLDMILRGKAAKPSF